MIYYMLVYAECKHSILDTINIDSKYNLDTIDTKGKYIIDTLHIYLVNL